MYSVVVERDPTIPKGPGMAYLYYNQTVIDSWYVITGGDNLDAKSYGGIAPPIVWSMMEEIAERIHPLTGKMLDGARLYPKKENEKEEYVPPRTVDGDDKFYTHPMGRSTGCMGPEAQYWPSYKLSINSAYWDNGRHLDFYVRDVVGAV